MKKSNDSLQNVLFLTQFGLSMITPLMVCIFLCMWAVNRFDIGVWIYGVGFFFGLGGSGTAAYKFYKREMAKSKKEEADKKVSFNSHH
ncbi:MAG: AtpZ/AtpI family protein [Clostridiales bacterium]|nr:AtpZ/AtpI family protein [Clostridiales bacterium]